MSILVTIVNPAHVKALQKLTDRHNAAIAESDDPTPWDVEDIAHGLVGDLLERFFVEQGIGVLSVSDFILRFEPDEIDAIRSEAGAEANPDSEDGAEVLGLLQAMRDTDQLPLWHPQVKQGIEKLERKGLLKKQRAEKILEP